MHLRLVLPLALAVFAGAIAAASPGCASSPAGAGGTGGATVNPAGAGGLGGGLSSAPGSGGGNTCNGGVTDGVCEYGQSEDCTCADCTNTALCIPGLCTNKGTTTCDHTYDSCTCPNCAEDYFCANPTLSNCTDGGACSPFMESCKCPNCWSYPDCQAGVAACNGGTPDGKCDPTESCTCVDCLGTPRCAPCANQGACVDSEPCDCEDCIHDIRCTDPAKCVNDGVCAIFKEGCGCDDCKDLPQCTQWLDAGTDAPEDAPHDASEDGAGTGGSPPVDAGDAGGG